MIEGLAAKEVQRRSISKPTLSGLSVLREISTGTLRLSSHASTSRASRESRSEALELLLLFWAFRTKLEREFFDAVYVYGHLDYRPWHVGPTEGDALAHWRRHVALPTDGALALLYKSSPELEGLCRAALVNDKAWASLARVYRGRLSKAIPARLRPTTSGSWDLLRP